MTNTNITKTQFNNRRQYGKFICLSVIVAAIILGGILFITLDNRSPDAHSIEIKLVGASANLENAAIFEQGALEAGQAFETERDRAAGVDINAADYKTSLDRVEFTNMNVDQRYTVSLAVNEGDVFGVTRKVMESLISDGLAVDLTPYIESGVIEPGDQNLSRVTYPEWVAEGMPATGK